MWIGALLTATLGLLATPAFPMALLPPLALLGGLVLFAHPEWGYLALLALIPFGAFRGPGHFALAAALAGVLARNGHATTLWAREPEIAEGVNERRVNPIFLPNVTLPESLTATDDLAAAVAATQVVISVAPSQFVASVMADAAPHLAPDALVVSASKGIELSTLRRMDEVMREIIAKIELG